jgi:hypothetical protein
MNRSEKILCAIYAFIAILALITTWANNLAFLALPEGRTIEGWVYGVYANYAAASFTNDLIFLALAACVFIIIEGRRLRIRFYLAYILLSGLTAISFTFPLFMIARQIAISRQTSSLE